VGEVLFKNRMIRSGPEQVATRTKVLPNRPKGFQETLCMGRRLESTACSFTLTGWLVTIFRAVIEAFLRPMLRLRKQLSDGRCIAGQFVRGDYTRLGWLPGKQALEERFGRRLVTSPLEDDVEHHPVSIHRSPQIGGTSTDVQVHFV
jgi:hypothetical protein